MAEQAQPEWFESLLESYHRRLVAFAHGMLGDSHQAHDVVQEAFVAAWRAAQEGTAPFGAVLDEAGAHRWLFRVTYRRAISQRRHNSVIRWESLDELYEQAAPRLDEPATTPFEERIAEGDALAGALARLSPQDAACLLLHVVHGLTIAEVAQIIEVGPEAAKKRVWRATERLRAAYFATSPRLAGERVSQ